MEDKIIQIAIQNNGELFGLSELGVVYIYSEIDGEYQWVHSIASPVVHKV